MTPYNLALKFTLFIVTFAAILGGVFVVFRVLGSIGNIDGIPQNVQLSNAADAANFQASSAALAMIDENAVQNSQQTPSTTPIVVPSSSISSSVTKNTSTSAKPVKKVQNLVAANTVAATASAPIAFNLSSDLGNFAISIADAIRSLAPVAPQPSTPEVVATSSSSTATSGLVIWVSTDTASTAPTVETATVLIQASTTSVAASPTSSALNLPYVVDNFSSTGDWQQEWGTVSMQSGSLAIGANQSTTGGEALLVGSNSWTNYIATAVVHWTSGQTFSLIARYNPGMNNVSCEFMNDGEVSVYRTIGGQRTLLGMGTTPNFNASQPVTASIQVKNDRVQCGLNGAIVNDYLYYGMPQQLLSGGLDIETWDPTPGKAQISVQSVDVEPLQ